MKFKHLGVVARNADELAEFYRKVFGCEDIRPRKTLTGHSVSQGNGVPNSEIYSAWLSLPGTEVVFLEIHEYRNGLDGPVPKVNEPGYGHMAFEVENIRTTFEAVIAAGGEPIGEITNLGTAASPFPAVYMRDPEGNVLELEQRLPRRAVPPHPGL